jgi:chemotaxis protein MotB
MNPRIPRARVSHDRWLVSYADFITLLFGFFVVMYAFAKADHKKQSQVSEAINSGFQSLSALPTGASAAAHDSAGQAAAQKSEAQTSVVMEEDVHSPSQVRDDLDRLRYDLMSTLSSQLANHSVSLEMGRDGLVISLREAGFFVSGSAAPKPAAAPTLHQIAARLSTTPYDLRIEGHTDNVPIHNTEFDSNWELSSARATRIARLFLEMNAMPPDRISAAGYAEFHPVADNSTAAGRAENRRVDLVVMPRAKINFAAPGAAPANGDWRRVTDDD